jgi:molybdenum cofactor cytidylyltransferase
VVFSKEIFDDLLSPYADQGARAVVHRARDRVREVPVDDPGIVANIDTPSDYQSLINDWHPR